MNPPNTLPPSPFTHHQGAGGVSDAPASARAVVKELAGGVTCGALAAWRVSGSPERWKTKHVAMMTRRTG